MTNTATTGISAASELSIVTPELTVIDGHVTTTSQQVAAHFGKAHAKVLRDIRNLLDGMPDEHKANFGLIQIDVEIGNGATRKDPAYRITRDGFTLLAMGFTGKEALQWKLAYLGAFNKMEAALTAPTLTITPAQAQHLRELVQLVVETGKQSHGETWARLHRKMKTNSYLALRPDQFDAACQYLRGKFDGESIAAIAQKHFPQVAQLAAPTPEPKPMIEAPSLKNRRWLVYFDHTGREHHEAVPSDAIVCSPKELPGLLLNERNGIFTAKDVLEIAGHANLRMMTEVCSLEARSKAKAMRDEIKTFGTTDLSEFAKSAWLELSLRGEFQGASA